MNDLGRPVGLHVRLQKGLNDLLESVLNFNLSAAQSFLINEKHKYISFQDKIISDFVSAKKDLDFLYYVHAAYWSGLTNIKSKVFASLKQEAIIAQDLKADGIVIHPGASKSGLSYKDKILYVAESINEINQVVPGIKLLLENVPHAGKNFGGNIEDFALLIEHIEKKEQIGFCIDTAHAFVFGYDLADEKVRKDFLQFLNERLFCYISLLHFNDAMEACGSFIDKHDSPGDGLIGEIALKEIMNDKSLSSSPIILELPSSCDQSESEIIKKIQSWSK